MAITRAQQVKQMLREGGRIEFRRGGIDRGFSAPSSAGQSPRGSNLRSVYHRLISFVFGCVGFI